MGDDLGLSGWAQCNHKGLVRGRQEGCSQRSGNVRTEVETGGMRPQAKESGPSLGAGKGKEMHCSLKPPEGTILLTP